MAQGGMVAFARGGIPKYAGDDESLVTDDGFTQSASGLYIPTSDGRADSSMQDQVLARLFAKLDAAGNEAALTLDSDETLDKAATARAELLDKSFGGAGMYDDISGQISKMRGENEGALSEGKGLAALQAAGAMLQGNDPMRGLGAAGAAFASSYAPALAAKRKADQSFTEMNINLAKAQRAEKAGLLKEADAYEQAAEKNKLDAYKAGTAARKAGLDSLPNAIKAAQTKTFRPAAPAKLSEQMEYLLASPADRAIMNQRYQQKAPGLAGTQTTAAALGDRTTAQIAADEEKQRKEIEEKRAASRQALEKDVAAEFTLSKLGVEPEYQEALSNAAKKVPGAKTPNQVRQELIAKEVERRWKVSTTPRGEAKTGGGGAGGKPSVSNWN
jgi:hypothetical protein